MKASPAFCITGSTVVEPLMTISRAARAGVLRLRTVRAVTSILPIVIPYSPWGLRRCRAGKLPARFPFDRPLLQNDDRKAKTA